MLGEELDGYGWVYGLVAEDDDARAEALARHSRLVDAWRPGPATGTLVDLTSAFTAIRRWPDAPRSQRYQRLAPYAVLFLDWEQGFPDEWRGAWPHSPWTTKESVLATFAGSGVTPATHSALEDLLVSTVQRRHRCQDRWYWSLARRLDNEVLRSRLHAEANAADERTQLRARFVLWALDHPDGNVGSAAWRRWLRAEGRPVTGPVAPSQLAAMKPPAAAAILADLAPADIARVLEGLHAGPAARILSALRPVELSARATELMDVRLAARMLKAMDQPAAAVILAAMQPSAAAARFPGSSRSELLLLMDTDPAVARLQAMTHAAAGARLQCVPPDRAAAFLSRMSPADAAAILTQMNMPPDFAQAVLTFPPPHARSGAEEG